MRNQNGSERIATPRAWFVDEGGRPLSFEDLQGLARRGRLRPRDQVWAEGMSRWVAARSVEGLFDVPAAAPRGGPTLQIARDEPTLRMPREGVRRRTPRRTPRRRTPRPAPSPTSSARLRPAPSPTSSARLRAVAARRVNAARARRDTFFLIGMAALAFVAAALLGAGLALS